MGHGQEANQAVLGVHAHFRGGLVRTLCICACRGCDRAAAVQEEVLSWVKGVGVIARGLLHCPEATARLFADAQAQGVRRVAKGQSPAATPPAASGGALLAAFLGDVAENFDAIAQPADRKLAAMAAAAALALPAPEVLEHFEVIAAAMTAVWEALEGGGNDFPAEYAWIGADPGDYFPTSEMPVCLSEDAQGAWPTLLSSYPPSVWLEVRGPTPLLCAQDERPTWAHTCTSFRGFLACVCHATSSGS